MCIARPALLRWSLCALVAVSGLCFVLSVAIAPHFSDGRVVGRGGKGLDRSFTMPLIFGEPQLVVDISFTMHLAALHAHRFVFDADDCVQKLTVNGISVPFEKFCGRTGKSVIDLGSYLHAGGNSVHVVLENTYNYGHLIVSMAHRDPVSFGFLGFFLPLFAACAWGITSSLGLGRGSTPFVWVFFTGVALRFFYLLQTPYYARTQDVVDHYTYVFYILRKAALPHLARGYEYFQPPLYYVLSALASLPASLIDSGNMYIIGFLMVQAFLISCAWLALSIGIARMLFPGRERSALFASIVFAVFPGTFFSAARISNDTLLLLLSAVTLLFLMRWWRDGRRGDWYALVVSLGLGLLTKANALALVPVVIACIVVRQWRQPRAAVPLILSLLLGLTVISGWFYATKVFLQGQSHIVGNLDRAADWLDMPEWVPSNLLVYRPWRVIAMPSTYPLVSEHRKYYPEYLLRTAFTGGALYDRRSLVAGILRAIHIVNIPLLLLAVIGVGFDLKRSRLHNLPLWLTGIALIGSQAALVANAHYFGLQNFRYIPLLVFPVTFAVITGIDGLPRMARIAACTLLLAFSALCVAAILVMMYMS